VVGRPPRGLGTLKPVAQALTIHELEGRCRQHLVRCERLFQLVGRWSAIADDPPLRIVLARVATHLATHTEWWTARLPVINGGRVLHGVDAGTEALGQHWATVLAALAEQGPTTLGIEGVAEALGRWIDDLVDWVAQHDPDLDAPTVRVLELVVGDLQRDRDALVAVLG
jgi:hypothetical protein